MEGTEAHAVELLRGYGDPACYEGMVQTLLRGQADGIEADGQGVLVHHGRADLYMLAARSEERLLELVEGIPLGATDVLLHGTWALPLVERVRRRFRHRNALALVPYAYYGELPGEEPGVDIRALGADTLDFIYAHYGHASREYLRERLADGVMLGAYMEGGLAGFIGEHVEGAMGLLHVMPDYRRHHLGYALERAAIRRTMLAGHTPFDQVFPDNTASHALQRHLGMTRAQGMLFWVTDDSF